MMNKFKIQKRLKIQRLSFPSALTLYRGRRYNRLFNSSVTIAIALKRVDSIENARRLSMSLASFIKEKKEKVQCVNYTTKGMVTHAVEHSERLV